MRLSELLERLRPAGTPGAGAASASDRIAASRELELAELIRELGALEAEAERILSSAKERAREIEADAIRRAEDVRSSAAERCAAAEAQGALLGDRSCAADVERLEAEASAEVQGLRASEDAVMESVVDAVLERLRSELGRVGSP